MSEEILTLTNLSFAHPGGKPVLQSLTWSLERGEFALLVGNTGCGKSTLLKLLVPALAPTGTLTGEIDCKSKRAGYVAQSTENQLVCDSVWHELAFPLENLGTNEQTMRRRVAEVAHFFNIEPWLNARTDELSGGQKQLLNVAKTLATNPDLLILDEPTAELDPVAEKNLAHALFRINRELGVTIILATHTPETMSEYATCTFELANGKIIKCTNTAQPKFLAKEKTLIDQNERLGCPAQTKTDIEQRERFGSAAQTETVIEQSERFGYAAQTETVIEPVEMPVPATHDLQVSTSSSTKGVLSTNEQGDTTLHLEDIWFKYEQNKPWVLHGFDLALHKGEIHAIVGGNASGKTTALLVAAGTLKPNRGFTKNTSSNAQALMPQNPKHLFLRDSVTEELQEWQSNCGFCDSDIEQALNDANLEDHKNVHPFDLSGGQQQLLALTKLMLTKPKLLLLDEPTKGLDANMKCKVGQMLVRQASAGTSVLLVTHDLEFANCVAHTTTMIFDGQATSSEPSEAFFKHNLFYKPTQTHFSHLWKQITNTDK